MRFSEDILYTTRISYSIYFGEKKKFEKETYALKIKLHVRTQAPEIPGKAGASCYRVPPVRDDDSSIVTCMQLQMQHDDSSVRNEIVNFY